MAVVSPGQLQEGPGLGLTSSSGHKEGGGLLGPTPRPPATPASSARDFLTLEAGMGERARPGLVLPIPGRWARLSSGPKGRGRCKSRRGLGQAGGGRLATPAEQLPQPALTPTPTSPGRRQMGEKFPSF